MYTVEEEQKGEQNETLFLEKGEKVEGLEEEDSILEEYLFETELTISEEHDQEYRNEEEIISEVIGEVEEELIFNYLDTQVEIILSDYEKKNMWDNYKNYIDEIVLNGLLNATLCR